MVIATLDECHRYLALHSDFASAFSALVPLLSAPLPSPGREVVVPERIFFQVDHYSTCHESEKEFEAHRAFIDIQIPLAGEERFGYAPISQLHKSKPWNHKRDIAFFSGSGQTLPLRPGHFAIFFPEDGHKPGLYVDGEKSSEVVKLVIKVACES